MSPSMSRITTKPSFLDLVDTLSRGSTESWRVLYAAAKHDEQVRREIEAALPLVDTEVTRADLIWKDLLAYLRQNHPTPERTDAVEATR